MGDGASKQDRQAEQRGPFVLLEPTGRGGMAQGARGLRVRKGTQGTIRRPLVWIKWLRPDRTGPEYVAALRKEGAIILGLQHKNIASLLEYDLEGKYLAYEFVKGVDLRQLLRAEGRLPVEVTTYSVVELCQALHCAHTHVRGGHAAGIVHCDVTPANILISLQGEVKLADFGIAQLAGAQSKPAGKAPYMAPEQWFGGEPIDCRADIFSIGVCMYEMLSGHRPADGTDDEIFAALSSGKHPPLPDDVPPEVRQIVERCLAPRPKDRFQNVAQLIRAFGSVRPSAVLELGRLAAKHCEYETVDYEALGHDLALPAMITATKQSSAAHLTSPSTQQAEEAVRAPHISNTHGWSHGLSIATAAIVGAALAFGAQALLPQPRATTTSAGSTSPEPPPASAPLEPASPPTTVVSTVHEALLAPPSQPSPAEPSAPEAVDPRPTVAPTERPRDGWLSVGSAPPMRVWVDGIDKGWTHLSERAPAGKHLIVVGNDPSDLHRSKTVTITPNKVSRVACTPFKCE